MNGFFSLANQDVEDQSVADQDVREHNAQEGQRFHPEPWRFDFFDVMRKCERAGAAHPRIGLSLASRQDYVIVHHDPYMDFPASNIAKMWTDTRGGTARIHLTVKFMGLLGPHGPLPYAFTEQWVQREDDSFPRFLDLLQGRFFQLFYRAWANSRAVTHHDRTDDRFFDYVGSTVGMGAAPYQHRDSLPDSAKLGFAGLIGAQIKSASRLRHFLMGLFGVTVDIQQLTATTLNLEKADQSRLGQRHATLGRDCLVGGRVLSLEDKITIRITTKNLDEYERYLPQGSLYQRLNDAIFLFLGHTIAWDVELAIPECRAPGLQLSYAGKLGWTSWLTPNANASPDILRTDARFEGIKQ